MILNFQFSDDRTRVNLSSPQNQYFHYQPYTAWVSDESFPPVRHSLNYYFGTLHHHSHSLPCTNSASRTNSQTGTEYLLASTIRALFCAIEWSRREEKCNVVHLILGPQTKMDEAVLLLDCAGVLCFSQIISEVIDCLGEGGL